MTKEATKSLPVVIKLTDIGKGLSSIKFLIRKKTSLNMKTETNDNKKVSIKY